MAQQMTNPDIICGFYSARMEVENFKFKDIFGVRHRFPFLSQSLRMGVLEVLNRHGNISKSDHYIITRPPNTVARLTTDYLCVAILEDRVD
jgi:hypothetical protein